MPRTSPGGCALWSPEANSLPGLGAFTSRTGAKEQSPAFVPVFTWRRRPSPAPPPPTPVQLLAAAVRVGAFGAAFATRGRVALRLVIHGGPSLFGCRWHGWLVRYPGGRRRCRGGSRPVGGAPHEESGEAREGERADGRQGPALPLPSRGALCAPRPPGRPRAGAAAGRLARAENIGAARTGRPSRRPPRRAPSRARRRASARPSAAQPSFSRSAIAMSSRAGGDFRVQLARPRGDAVRDVDAAAPTRSRSPPSRTALGRPTSRRGCSRARGCRRWAGRRTAPRPRRAAPGRGGR